MLPHLCDISKIEVQVKDQYELKVNKSKKSARIRSYNRLSFAVDLFPSDSKPKIVYVEANQAHLLP